MIFYGFFQLLKTMKTNFLLIKGFFNINAGLGTYLDCEVMCLEYYVFIYMLSMYLVKLKDLNTFLSCFLCTYC